MNGLTRTILGASALAMISLGSANANSDKEKLFEIEYRSLSGNPKSVYSCLEGYEGFKMHCVRLAESGGADVLALDGEGRWYFTSKGMPGTFITEREEVMGREKVTIRDYHPFYNVSPPGTLFFHKFNEIAQGSFKVSEKTDETEGEYCKRIIFCQSRPKRFPPASNFNKR